MTDPLDFSVDLDSVRDRIKGLKYFVTVEDLAAASEALGNEDSFGFVAPAAFVSVASETAEPNKTIGGRHRQRLTVTLSILFAESSARADRDGTDRADRTRKALIRQLAGWRPNGALGPLQYTRYLIRATGGGYVWGEVMLATTADLTI